MSSVLLFFPHGIIGDSGLDFFGLSVAFALLSPRNWWGGWWALVKLGERLKCGKKALISNERTICGTKGIRGLGLIRIQVFYRKKTWYYSEKNVAKTKFQIFVLPLCHKTYSQFFFSNHYNCPSNIYEVFSENMISMIKSSAVFIVYFVCGSR